MIKSLILRFFSAFSKPETFGEDDREAIVHRQQNIKLKGSMQERLKATQEWSKPEAVAQRIADYKPGVKPPSSYEETPLPNPLPKEFEGQQPSTIRAILRQRKNENNLEILRSHGVYL